MLYDRAMFLLAFSAHSPGAIDANRSGAILARRTEPRAAELVREAGVHRAHAPVVVPSDPGVADRIGMAVRHEGVVLGYLICTAEPGDIPIIPPYRAIVTAAADELGGFLHVRSLEQRSRHLSAGAAVRDLLGDDAGTRDRAAAALLRGGLPETTHGYVAVTFSPRPPAAELSHPERLELESLLARVTSASTSAGAGALIENAAVLISPVAADHARAVQRLRQNLPGDVHLGVGSMRAELAEVFASAAEASLALAATWRDATRYGQIAQWSDLGADQLLLRLPLDRLGPADLPRPVRELLAAPNGLELARTVESYLDHGGDAQATARSLPIHRSTLYYRLDRVAAITGVDVRAGATRHTFHTGLRVATLCGLRPPS